MGRLLMFVWVMQLAIAALHGQESFTMTGRVTDTGNNPLAGAYVSVMPSEKVVVTDGEGRYAISAIRQGVQIITVSYMGFQSQVDTVVVNGDLIYNARLAEETVNLQEVVIAERYPDRDLRNGAIQVDVVDAAYLKQNLGGSLMQSLENLPGVTSINIGSGQSKPVIRGLGFNRVAVVENGIKHEGQQWGSDHGIEIDQYAVAQVAVVRGPASLMYGSDAIAGVVDIRQNRIPENNSLTGSIELTGKTNNDLLGTSLALAGRRNRLYMGMRATLLGYGDYRVPTDSVDIYSYRAPLYKNRLRNTAGNEKNFHLNFGWVQTDFQSSIHFSYMDARNGFFANAHGLEPRNVDAEVHDRSSRDILYPYHDVNHLKIINNTQWHTGNIRFDAGLGYQRNLRKELSQYVNHGYMPPLFPDAATFNSDLERKFDKYVLSGYLRSTVAFNGKISVSAGLSSDFMDNRIDGRNFIIPAYQQINSGIFMLGNYAISRESALQAGIRYDHGRIVTKSYHDWFQSPVISGDDTTMVYLRKADDLDKWFSNFTWMLGYTFSKNFVILKVNAGTGFRMPLAKELAANGVNYHRFSYEVGNPNLSPEKSWQLDAGLEYQPGRLEMGITPFLNYFTNYIYLDPGYEFDRLYGNGNQIHNYSQTAVFRYGGEIYARYQIIQPLSAGITGEYAYSRQLTGSKQGFSLPFSPPASAIISLKYQKAGWGVLESGYLSVNYRITAGQSRIVPPEELTKGWQTINVGIGGEVKMNRQRLMIALQVQNLLNSKYFNHTSYYRLINVPEPGRNVVLHVTIPVSIKSEK